MDGDYAVHLSRVLPDSALWHYELGIARSVLLDSRDFGF